MGKYHGQSNGMLRACSTERTATLTAATLPWPPNSATKRPPGFSARWTPCRTASASWIQCSAAFENTASNSASNGRAVASRMRGVETEGAGGSDHRRLRHRCPPPSRRIRRSARSARRRRSQDRGSVRPAAERAARSSAPPARGRMRHSAGSQRATTSVSWLHDASFQLPASSCPASSWFMVRRFTGRGPSSAEQDVGASSALALQRQLSVSAISDQLVPVHAGPPRRAVERQPPQRRAPTAERPAPSAESLIPDP